MNGGKSGVYADRVGMNFRGHEVNVRIDRKLSNAPTVFDLSVNSVGNKDIGFNSSSRLAYSDIR